MQPGDFKGAFHIATMALYHAQSSLELANNKVSVCALLEFCDSRLVPWVALVDCRASRASMQVGGWVRGRSREPAMGSRVTTSLV